jgi:pseudouridylate synthase
LISFPLLLLGAEPATVAILGGKMCVGLEDAQLELLAKAGPKAIKCSRRDIPVLSL